MHMYCVVHLQDQLAFHSLTLHTCQSKQLTVMCVADVTSDVKTRQWAENLSSSTAVYKLVLMHSTPSSHFRD